MALSYTDALTQFASRPYGSESSVCTVLLFGIMFLGRMRRIFVVQNGCGPGRAKVPSLKELV